MKTIVFILFASVLALVAVAALAARPPLPDEPAGSRTADARRRVIAWRDIKGAEAILAPRFVSPNAEIVPVSAKTTLPSNDTPPTLTGRWILPLIDQSLTQTEKTEGLAPDLQDAIYRMEPMFDPTRVDGPLDAVPLRISPGSAALADVFGEQWHLASDDPNVDIQVPSIGIGWRLAAIAPCDFFRKRRPREVGMLALDALSLKDCSRILHRRGRRGDDAEPLVVVGAPISLAAFAAPMPGGRLSSTDFWAAQKARVAAIEAHLLEQREARLPQQTAAKP